MLRKTLSSTPTTIGDRVARFVISDESVDRQNEQVVQSGGDFSLYLQNPVVLYGHDPMFPIGTGANIRRDGTKTIADLTLAPPGVSQKADEVWGLIKSGILKSTSIGFDPVDVEPMDPSRTRGPLRYKRWILCEISICAIPAQSRATLIDATNAKSHNADRAARMQRAAEVMAKAERMEKAWEQTKKGFPTAAPVPSEFRNMSRRERMAHAEALIHRGAPPASRAPLTLREAATQSQANHAAAIGALQQEDSRSARILRAARVVAPHGRRIGGLGNL